MQRNYMNSNDVFPILDLIRRERQKVAPSFRDAQGAPVDVSLKPIFPEITDWRVTGLSIKRDTTNPINNRAIKIIDIEYDVGATATVELLRGANPPVENFGRDTDYINHVMLRQVRMTTKYENLEEIMLLTINKTPDFTAIEGVAVKYEGRINTIQMIDTVGNQDQSDAADFGYNEDYLPEPLDSGSFYDSHEQNDEVIL